MATNPPPTDARVISATTDRLFETVEGLLGRPLRDDERLSFTTRLAGINTAAVAPGDLITADLFNALRADVNDLAMRLALVEQGTTGAPVLFGTDPPGEIAVSSVLTLVGTGFDPLNAVDPIIVRLGELTISQFNVGSMAGRLRFTVPDGLTGLPRIVPATVQVGTRLSNMLQVALRPRPQQPQAGNIFISASPTTPALPATINVGNELTFIWRVDAQTARPVPCQFDLEITNTSGASVADWRSLLAVTPASTTISAGSPQDITTRVTVPTGATSARILFRVSTPEPVTIQPPTFIDLPIGRPADIPDERFAALSFDLTDGTTSGSLRPDIVFDGQRLQGIQVTRSIESEILMLLTIPAPIAAGSGAGNYTIEPEFEGAPAGWSVRSVPRNLGNLRAPDSRSLTIIITNSEAAGAGTTRMLRVWARNVTTTGASPNFSTFRRFPVQAIN